MHKRSWTRRTLIALSMALLGLAGLLLLGGCGGEPSVSIQELIDAADRESTVVIPAGIYRENLHLRKSLTLVGDSSDPSQVVIRGVEDDRPAIYIVGDGTCQVTLQGLTIESSKENGILVERNAKAHAEQVHVKDCQVSGFSVRGAASLTMIDCTSSGNTRNGVSVVGDSSATLVDCELRESAAAGLAARTTGTISVTESAVAENGEHGIKINGETTLVMEGVTVKRNGGGQSTAGAFVTLGTALSGNIDTGIYMEDEATLEMASCTIADSARDGIVILDNAAVEARDCTIRGNARNGIVAATDGSVTIHDCSITGNDLGIWLGKDGAFEMKRSTVQANRYGGVASIVAACVGQDVLENPYRRTGPMSGGDNVIAPRGEAGSHDDFDCCPSGLCAVLRRELAPPSDDSTGDDS